MNKSNHLKKLYKSLPANWYYSDKIFNKEISKIWLNNWIYICHSSQLNKNLSFVTATVSKQNIIVLRNGSGNLKSYYNTCRHRGSKLISENSGTLQSKLIICPYHQWSYSADSGELLSVASFSNPPEGFCKENFPLYEIALKEWRGCIFINLSEKPYWNIDKIFQRKPDALKNFPLETMSFGHLWKKTLNCNWKTFWENFNECLHCPNVHPELTNLVPMFTRKIINPKDLPGSIQKSQNSDPKYSGGLRIGAETWSEDGSAQGKVIKSLSNDEILRGHVYASSWPSMFIGGYADHVRIVRILPKDSEKVELTAEWLFESETLEDKNYNKDNVISFACRVMEQDGRVCELNQTGIYSKPHKNGLLMPEEYVIKNFHNWIREQFKINRKD